MGEKPSHRRTSRGVVSGCAVALLLGGVQVVTSAPAAAAPGPAGPLRIASTSAANSINKTQTATCPAGRKVLGGAGRIDGAAAGEVGLVTAMPTANGSGYTVSAAEDANGTAGTWSLTAIAFCAPAPAGLQYLSYNFGAGSTKSRWSSITCPKGKKVLGAGATITATAYEDEAGTPATWSITATATCVSAVQGLAIEQAATAQSSDVSIASATLTCPTGTSLYGVAGEIVGGNGEVLLRQLDATPASEARVRAAEDATGTANLWSVHSYGICAK